MKIQVLGQISALRETFSAPWYRAFKRLFSGMNSQMIEKVTSLSELLAAALILAFHYAANPFRLIVFVS